MMPLSLLGCLMGGARPPTLAELIASAVATQGGLWLDASSGVVVTSAPNIDTWTPVASTIAGLFAAGPATGLKPDTSTITTPAGDVSAVKFNGGTVLDGEYQQHNGAASLFSDFHKPAGSTIYLVARTTGAGNGGTVLDTGGSNSGQTGISLAFNGGTHRIDFSVADSTGGGDYVAAVGIDLDDLSLSMTDLHVYEIAWGEAAGVSVRIDDEVPVTGSVARTPSTGAAHDAMTVGGIGAGSVSYLFGEIVHVGLLKGIPSSGTRRALRKGLGAQVGIPLA